MNEASLRIAGRWPLLLFIFLNAAPGGSIAADRTAAAPATRQQLIGAWRLLSIQIEGPSGSMSDPFYDADSTGMLIYDASGWMSVQIAGQHRPAMDAPALRPSHDTAKNAQLKSAVLDSYYAYFGTWEYDRATATVTHHVISSLIPGETGMSYSQTVTLDGAQLIFTTRRVVAGGAAVQKKVWQRVSGPAP
jgi:Lipocalin-like domain